MAAPDGLPEEHLKRKIDLYASLNAMLESDDEYEDPIRQESIRKMDLYKLAALRKQGSRSLARSKSDVNLRSKAQKQDDSSAPGPVSRPPTSSGTRPPALSKAKTFAGPSTDPSNPSINGPSAPAPSVATSKVIGKRKREEILQLVPEDRLVFKGCKFFFFPNTNTNKARNIRIAKAVQYGVAHEKVESDAVTHIVVDRDLGYDQVQKFVNLDRMSDKVVVVNDAWPADCIMWNRLVDPSLPQFVVKGYAHPTSSCPEIVKDSFPHSSTTTSEESLKLKAAGKAVLTKLPETPKTDDTIPSSPVLTVHQHVDTNIDEAERPANLDIASTADFDAIIRQAKILPLDDEEATSRPGSSSGSLGDDTQSDSDDPKNAKTKQQKRQEKFQCMHAHTGEKSNNPNIRTIDILQEMATYYDQMQDQWRTRAYRQAMTTLRKTNSYVRTKEEALALPQIGERIAIKIEEIVSTGRLRRLDSANADPTDHVFRTFMKVYGVGPAAAQKWIDQGFTTLDDLVEKASLTEGQKIGIEHYHDFNTRIPRAEVKQHGDTVRRGLKQIDREFDVVIGGSYRRGAKDSGDIDCLVTHPVHSQATIRNMVLGQLVPGLTRAGFFVAALAETSRADGSKWHGASCIPTQDGRKIWRRIDLLLVPAHEFGAALIYFTGNDIFNRSMRLLASTKQMRLNQRGLFREVLRGKGRVKLTDGELVEGRDEQRIFEILGVPWRPPQHRIP